MPPNSMPPGRGEVTVLLDALRNGGADAESRLIGLVYTELRRLARSYLRRERPDHTLQSIDLVHEAYLRMAGESTPWQNRAHFFGIAAQAMRRILVDHARARCTNKRGDGRRRVLLDDAMLLSEAEPDHLLDVHAALDGLAEIDPRQARLVELRFFAGLSIEETAAALGCSARTVSGEWRLAQAWLRRRLAALDRHS